MRIVIDEEARTLTTEDPTGSRRFDLYTRAAFEIISRQWLRVGWNQRYTYTFSWLGRPIIQLPDDLMRLQEVIYRVRPDVIIETGVAHGGALIFYASLLEVLKRGRVIGIEVALRPENRRAIASHELSPRITVVDGSSVDPATVAAVKALIGPGERVMVVLDSNHTREHVTAELAAYAELVSDGSYLVVTDGFMRELCDVPRGRPEWISDNPAAAAEAFAAARPDFVLEQPAWPFNESELQANVTHWPAAWLRRGAHA